MKFAASIVALAGIALAGCDNDASVASRNLSQAADNFEINRRIVFYNGITGEYMLEMLRSSPDTDWMVKRVQRPAGLTTLAMKTGGDGDA